MCSTEIPAILLREGDTQKYQKYFILPKKPDSLVGSADIKKKILTL